MQSSNRWTRKFVWQVSLLGMLMVHAASSEEVVHEFREGTVISRVARGGRTALRLDGIEQLRVDGKPLTADAGAKVQLGDRERAWESIQVGENGMATGRKLFGGYVSWQFESKQAEVLLLDARGHSAVVANGVCRTGNPYSTNWYLLPVEVVAGKNHFLFQVGRGRFKAQLLRPETPLFLTSRDPTLPDAVRGNTDPQWGGVILVNSSRQTEKGLSIEARIGDGPAMRTELAPILPLAMRKVGFRFRLPGDLGESETQPLRLTLRQRGKNQVLANLAFDLKTVSAEDKHKRTFNSKIDGSVQYFAVTPAHRPADADPAERPGLVLTLHGASVKARRQAGVYGHKDWVHVVAPTNRRPFGFDWEDWGRWDALEVLELAARQWNVDPAKRYLTGHSMGGHGTWHVGVTFPDRFAAIGPSAGWVSFYSYGGKRKPSEEDARANMFDRASQASDTLSLVSNLKKTGVYILHGDADRNVPVSQARRMREALAAFHPNFVYKEQPGAGHWWGNRCCDWPAMFGFFQQHQLPAVADVREVSFTTASPAVSSRHYWASIEDQLTYGRFSKIDLTVDPEQATFQGTTKNVRRLILDQQHWPNNRRWEISIDKSKVTAERPEDGPLQLIQVNGKWTIDKNGGKARKSPMRYGGFKEAFNRRVVFVYGTTGTKEENAWALEKARLDAETFWYRGNSGVKVVSDREFSLEEDADRNVILYGHRDSNQKWSALLGDSCPVDVRQGIVRVGEKEFRGEDLGVLFLYPRKDSSEAMVGVVTGSGKRGREAVVREPYFVSGVAYPDLTVLRSSRWSLGSEAVEATGYFDSTWQVKQGQLEYRQAPTDPNDADQDD